MTVNGGWVEKTKYEHRPSKMDYSKIEGSIMIKPSFKFCKTCNDSGQYIKLEGIRSRSLNLD